MRMVLASLLCVLPLSAVATADTKTAPDVQKMKTDDCERARKANKTCVLTIEDEQIEGGRPTIDDTALVLPITGKSGSLIRIRRDFIVEILKSAEDL